MGVAIKIAAAGVALCLVLVVAVVFFAGRKFLYHPTITSSEELEQLARKQGWKRETVSAGEHSLVGLVRAPTSSTAPWLLFFGGNASPIAGNQRVLELVRGEVDAGLAVFAYPGYDGSEGSPSESSLLEAGRAVAKFLISEQHVAPDHLLIMGQSLGSGVAAATAFELETRGLSVRRLILISPYRSISRVFDDIVPLVPVGWAVRDRYDTESVIARIKSPLTIVHGADDRLITVQHGRALAEQRKGRVEYLELEGRGHNDVFDERAIEALRRTLRPSGDQ